MWFRTIYKHLHSNSANTIPKFINCDFSPGINTGSSPNSYNSNRIKKSFRTRKGINEEEVFLFQLKAWQADTKALLGIIFTIKGH